MRVVIDVLLWVFDTSSKVNEVRQQMSNISSNVTSTPSMRWIMVIFGDFQFILCTSILSLHDSGSLMSFLSFSKKSWKTPLYRTITPPQNIIIYSPIICTVRQNRPITIHFEWKLSTRFRVYAWNNFLLWYTYYNKKYNWFDSFCSMWVITLEHVLTNVKPKLK